MVRKATKRRFYDCIDDVFVLLPVLCTWASGTSTGFLLFIAVFIIYGVQSLRFLQEHPLEDLSLQKQLLQGILF
ncbi:hypothetical protein [Photobacterium leiognathi]|uniref:hypothetical protein n=1 Tax=Photobacterium leiognathi TaxID=553611 RepID=UPI002736F636|nr:hypothetical protein [Photobacterium leiognathi]